MNKTILIFLISIIITGALFFILKPRENSAGEFPEDYKLSYLENKSYSASEINIEEDLGPSPSYNRYIATYSSEGSKVISLLTVPIGEKPENGWPVIILLHGYITPETYSTTSDYEAFVQKFSEAGFIVLKPDFRGYGNSEGQPLDRYYTPYESIDTMNAISAIKNFDDADENKIGIWGHSTGGLTALKTAVISQDVKATVIWSGVVGSYSEINDWLKNWNGQEPWYPSERELAAGNLNKENLIGEFDRLIENKNYLEEIDPHFNLSKISIPLQIHHSKADDIVPWEFSQSLKNKLDEANRNSELILYENEDHNISTAEFSSSTDKAIEFFKNNL